jgi:hypothetical protein
VDDFRFEKIDADSVTINGTRFKLEKGSEKYSDYIEEEKRWDVKVYFTVIHPPYTGPPMMQGMRPNSYLNDIYIAELSFSDGTNGKFKMDHYARSYDPFTKIDATKFRAIEVELNTPVSDKP